MKKTLGSLLVALAFIGGALVYRVDNGVTMAELSDAGFAQCPPVDVACEVRVSDAWLDRLEARGADGGRRYRRIAVDARDCRAFDAGYVISDRRLYNNGQWRNGFEPIDGRCKVVANAPPDDAGTGLREMALECGCRKAAGLCRFQLPDAGLQAVPFGVTVGPGYPLRLPGDAGVVSTETFGGVGCERKACVEFFGESSQPETCPGG